MMKRTMEDVYDLHYRISEEIEKLRYLSTNSAAYFDGAVDEIEGTPDEQYAACAELLGRVHAAQFRFTGQQR